MCISVFKFAIELFNSLCNRTFQLWNLLCNRTPKVYMYTLASLIGEKNTANFLKLVGYKYQEYNSIQCKELVSDLIFFHLLFHF